MILKMIILLLICFNSCDILRNSPFEVITWSPGSGCYSSPEEIAVSLTFSGEPNKDSVERHFSLNSENGRVRGTFSWTGKKVTFTPLTPLGKNMDYNISLSSEAHDKRGLSMDRAFHGSFTTRSETDRPVLVSYYPAMYGQLNNPRSEVRLEFSIPVELIGLYNNVSFSPAMTGFWKLNDDGKLAVFTPAEPWLYNRRYEIRVSGSLTAKNGMSTGSDFTGIFYTNTASGTSFLAEARRITKDGNFIVLIPDTEYLYASEMFAENQGWENGDRLSLVFVKPVDSLSVINCLTAEGASSLVMESLPGYVTELFFNFNSMPAYESRFTFRIRPGIKDITGYESKDEYVYRIFANGEYSRPPQLAGIRLPLAPGNPADNKLVSYGINSLFDIIHIKDGADNYPSGESIKTWIELYFTTAKETSVDPFSVMQHFRIETSNNVLSFFPRQVKTENFSNPVPREGWEHLDRIEITGILINSVNFGIVNFQIQSGLRDNRGNINEKAAIISLIK